MKKKLDHILLGCVADDFTGASDARSIPAKDAVHDTLAALKWLEDRHVEQFYLKYCSTFDSTPKGNIGPDIDAALEG